MIRKIENLTLRMENAFMMSLCMAGEKEKKSLKTEAGSHLLEVLGTIIIAVIILIYFRAQIVNLFSNAIGQTTSSVNNLFTNVD